MYKAKRIIVVLGMHRSGTSAITRGLEVLGVQLGEQLLAAAANDNAKGYFEDEEIFNLNVKILEALGYDWKTSADISGDLLTNESLQPLRHEALSLLRARTDNFPLYGFKDPRVVKLLPFWQSIFNELNIEPSYLIVIRHPMSVVRSLAADNKRGDIQDEKGYLLWLDHVLISHALTKGANRVVVEYDVVMEQPVDELKRISSALNLPFDEKGTEATDFAEGFLTNTLRHTTFTLDDLAKADRVPADVVTVYAHMQKYAKDIASIDENDELSALNLCAENHKKFQPVFNYVDYIESAYRKLETFRTQDHKHINELDVILKSYEEAHKQINHEKLNLERDKLNLEAEKATVEFEKGKIEVEKAKLEAELAHNIKNQGKLNQLLMSQNKVLDVMRDSTSWRVTKPIRFIGHHVKSLRNKMFK